MDVFRRISRKNCRTVVSRESNQRKNWLLFLCLQIEKGDARVTEISMSRMFCAYNAHSPPEPGTPKT